MILKNALAIFTYYSWGPCGSIPCWGGNEKR